MTGDDRDAGEAAVRSELRARIDAWVAPTFRVSYKQEPHPDEVALTDRLTDAVLAMELELRAARDELERLGRVEQEPRPGHGPGVPGAMHLEAFGQSIADAFGDCPYHVGSSATSKTWRDVDVRLILDDDRFAALFPGFANAHHIDAWWSLLCAALSELGRARTGLPIDFQIQSMTEANEKYSGIRNPLFLIRARDEHEPKMASNADQAARDEREAPGAELFSDECDCDCQPGQRCLCPERDCYCGPCRVCGPTPQQAVHDGTGQ